MTRALVPIGLSITAVIVSVLVGVFAVSGPISQDSASAARVATFDGTWSTGWQVQNLDSSNSANLTATYYNDDGTVAYTDSTTVGALTEKTFFPMPVASGFAGSVVVNSDTQIAAIANLFRSAPSFMLASYSGISTPRETVYVPLLQRNNSGNQSKLYVQNAGSTAVTVSIAFNPSGLPGRSVSAPTVTGITIQPGAAYGLDQATQSALDGLDENGSASTNWVGSATITSVGGPVGAVVNQSNGSGLLSYSGFGEGGATLYAPLVQDLNGADKWSTGIQLQNLGSSASTVTATVDGIALDFGAEATCVNPDNSSQLIINAGSPCTIFPLKFNRTEVTNKTPFAFGGAIFTGSGGSELVGIVNQISTDSNSVFQATAYNMFTSSGANELFVPLMQHNNGNYLSGIAIMNNGSAATTITVSDSDGSLSDSNCHTGSLTIQPGESCIVFPILQGSRSAETGYAKAGFIAAPEGSTLQAVLNQVVLSGPSGDTFTTYEGFTR